MSNNDLLKFKFYIIIQKQKFSGGSILFVEQTFFSRTVYKCSSNRHKFSRRVLYRTDIIFQGRSICLSNRYKFSRKLLFSSQTYTNFSGSYINFPGSSIFSSYRYQFPGASIFSSNRYSI